MEVLDITECEKRIMELLRKLKPYGKLEIAINQDGSQLSVYLTNIEKEVLSKTK